MPRPLCFIAMPFGRKEAGGRSVEFDAVWQELIAPAIEAADMQPLRADEEQIGGIIHKPMFERLLLCEFAVADLTLANANVFYEIGVRHAARPATTVLIVADEVRLPFDVAMLRTMPYRLGADGRPSHAREDAAKLGDLLKECRAKHSKDSPLFQLLDGIRPLEVPSDRTDVFREQVAYAQGKKAELAQARKSGKDAIDRVRQSLGRLDAVESGGAIHRHEAGGDPRLALVERRPRRQADPGPGSARGDKAHGLRLKSPKSQAGRRDISLHEIVVDALRDHRRQQLELRMALGAGKPSADALVFPDLEDGPQAPSNVSRAWGLVAADLGMPEITLHGLRHTHASQLIEAGVDIVTISKRLGHASPMSP